MFKKIILLLIGLVVVVTLAVAWGRRPQELQIDSAIKVGAEAPDFALPNLRGKQIKLSDYKGKVVFLNFWATWCPPCRTEMPSMQKLYNKLGQKDFAIVAVALDKIGGKGVKPFIEKNNYTFPVLLDPSGSVATRYRVQSIPSTLIIDRQGKIVNLHIGARNWGTDAAIKTFTKIINE